MKRHLIVSFVAIILASPLVLVGSFNVALAATVPPSIINSDTTWTVANSPYSLSGPTLVASGATLTIQPGATVNLNGYYLEVNGTLKAVGTSTTPVYIVSQGGSSVGQVEFTASSVSWNEQTSSGCIIQNAIINQAIISVSGCTAKISDNIFNDGTVYDGLSLSGGASIISNNVMDGMDVNDNSTLYNNTIRGGMGIYGGSPIISKNMISGSSGYFGIGRDWDRDYYTIAIEHQSSPILTGNTILGDIAFNMNDNGYEYNIFNALITGNIIQGVLIGGGSGTVAISSNIISNSGITSNSAISTIISNNLIIDTDIGLQIGDATVQNNTIANSQIAIQLNNAVSPIISGNNIENYSQYSIKLAGTSSNINAPNNWWGTADQQAIGQSIYDQKNDFNLGKVNFLPILNAPNPSDPPVNAQELPANSHSTSPFSTSTSTTTPIPMPIPELTAATILVVLSAASAFAIAIRRKTREKPSNI